MKVTITFEDTSTGNVSIKADFVPPIKNPETASPAQALAILTLEAAVNEVKKDNGEVLDFQVDDEEVMN